MVFRIHKYSKNYEFVPSPLPSRCRFGHSVTVFRPTLLIVANRYFTVTSPLLTITYHYFLKFLNFERLQENE